MDTPWGALPVSDAHVHFFSHHFFLTLAETKSVSVEALGQTLGWQMPADKPARLAETWVRELDRHGVERAALIASIPGDHNSGHETKRADNATGNAPLTANVRLEEPAHLKNLPRRHANANSSLQIPCRLRHDAGSWI